MSWDLKPLAHRRLLTIVEGDLKPHAHRPLLTIRCKIDNESRHHRRLLTTRFETDNGVERMRCFQGRKCVQPQLLGCNPLIVR